MSDKLSSTTKTNLLARAAAHGRSFNTRFTLFMLAIFIASLWSLALYATWMLRADMQHQLGEQQYSVVSSLANHIERELVGRKNALQQSGGPVTPVVLADPAAMQAFFDGRPALGSLFNGGVIAYRLDGTAVAELPVSAGRVGINYMDVDTVAAALTEGRTSMGRPVIGRKLKAPVVAMVAPIRDADGRVIGALAGVINLGLPNFLTELSQGIYGKTGGYLLVSARHRLVVSASDPRRIMEPLVGPGVIPEIDRYVAGHEGYSILTNALNVEVIAAVKQIPTAGWYVGITLPTAEAFAPIHAMQQRMLVAALVLTLLAGLLCWWMIRRQLAPMVEAVKTLTALSQSDQPPQPLAIARKDAVGDLSCARP